LASVLTVDLINETIGAYRAAFPSAPPAMPELPPAIEPDALGTDPKMPAAETASSSGADTENEEDKALRIARGKRLKELRKKHGGT
jgi:hypothetical protein